MFNALFETVEESQEEISDSDATDIIKSRLEE
jgi:hypothetical protein